MDADDTLLGSAAPLAPGILRSLASSSHHVCFSFIPAIVHPLVDHFLVCSKHPPWKQLITDTLAKDERTSLITKIFSDRDEVEIVMQLSGDNAQAFIDTIAMVSSHDFRLKESVNRPRCKPPHVVN